MLTNQGEWRNKVSLKYVYLWTRRFRHFLRQPLITFTLRMKFYYPSWLSRRRVNICPRRRDGVDTSRSGGPWNPVLMGERERWTVRAAVACRWTRTRPQRRRWKLEFCDLFHTERCRCAERRQQRERKHKRRVSVSSRGVFIERIFTVYTETHKSRRCEAQSCSAWYCLGEDRFCSSGVKTTNSSVVHVNIIIIHRL